MARSLTTDEFKEKYAKLNKPVEIIGEYTNCKNKILCKCTICSQNFEITPDMLMQGQIHRDCARRIADSKRTSNTEEFKNKLSNVNSDIDVIGNYIKVDKKIKIQCKICKYIWETTPNILLSGSGCPNGSKRDLKTKEQLMEEIESNKKIDVTLLEEIKNCYTKIKVKCNICNHEWKSTQTRLSRYSCPNCSKIKSTKTQEQFESELYTINHNIKIIGKYKNQYTKIKCKCLMDDFEWGAIPTNLLKGTGCPICSESKGERKIRNFLEDCNIIYHPQKTYDGLLGIGGKPLSYDFYLPEYNLLIEYQGEFHEGKSNDFVKSFYDRQHEHDLRKNNYAKKHGISLLEIWYWDFNNIEKILSEYLYKSQLNTD